MKQDDIKRIKYLILDAEINSLLYSISVAKDRIVLLKGNTGTDLYENLRKRIIEHDSFGEITTALKGYMFDVFSVDNISPVNDDNASIIKTAGEIVAIFNVLNKIQVEYLPSIA